jgi:hypothetical protein
MNYLEKKMTENALLEVMKLPITSGGIPLISVSGLVRRFQRKINGHTNETLHGVKNAIHEEPQTVQA